MFGGFLALMQVNTSIYVSWLQEQKHSDYCRASKDRIRTTVRSVSSTARSGLDKDNTAECEYTDTI